MFELIKTEKNKRFYKLNEPIKYIQEYHNIAKEFWEDYHLHINYVKQNNIGGQIYNEYNQETIPDFIEYIVISDGVRVEKQAGYLEAKVEEREKYIEERLAFIGYKCEKTNDIKCTYVDVEITFLEDLSRLPYNYQPYLYDDNKILERIIDYDKIRKEWNDLTKDELIDKYKNCDYKYDFGEYVYEKMQKEIIMEFIKNDVKILKYASEEILEDKKFMIELLKINFDAMKYISYYHFGCNCDGE